MAFALFALWSVQAASSPSPAPIQPAPSPVEGSQVEGDAALIRNSGSTNTLPYTISVKPDGRAVVTVGSSPPEDRRLPLDQTQALFAELRAAMPLDALARGHCMHSASFGSTTTITFGGAATPDLGCAPDPAARHLAVTVAGIVGQLRLSVMRFHAPPPPP